MKYIFPLSAIILFVLWILLFNIYENSGSVHLLLFSAIVIVLIWFIFFKKIKNIINSRNKKNIENHSKAYIYGNKLKSE
ncbi:MAG: hypothetical protein A2275_09775 [Bacteroidetes bacterium RIFOXYA12_FULL_35_11]|nr:MAG: hypothetical protein A2X01_02145 [Bacteroidetes bacterium GWF2_35_48]OFY82342.1 MAG: hypothetical protein A2275_09775 [Bacteroidetes bacterium RIFOXYA12_FULL_35_11]OFY94211.1 MAG: hypothetical protein A2309_07030 [Bacteroidetes bacterium RIFOXYB2_FULL_35_7]OFY95986.1 MAG: hypothetical protein A2491_07355 [Bacteroidetes bacterium RIFOXYC12_FULL_35_7]HBX49613.1 hypothetical protein [Bacteroidales bacterium]